MTLSIKLGVPLMSMQLELRRRIYDLYSFDAPYDLEPIGLSDLLRDYENELDSHESSTPANMEEQGDEFRG